jgi:hypothetical protein
VDKVAVTGRTLSRAPWLSARQPFLPVLPVQVLSPAYVSHRWPLSYHTARQQQWLHPRRSLFSMTQPAVTLPGRAPSAGRQIIKAGSYTGDGGHGLVPRQVCQQLR